MSAVLSDYVQRAAEAFVAANRAADPELAARLRETAYGFLDLLRQQEEEGHAPGLVEVGPAHPGWCEVLSRAAE